MRGRELSVLIYGAGKVGRALASALAKKQKNESVTLRAARRGFPKRIHQDVLVLAVRDRELPMAVETLLARDLLSRATVVMHVAGALDSSLLAPLRPRCAGVAQMHPMISFASKTRYPSLSRGNVHVQGDPRAVSRGRQLARALGMTPRTIPRLNPVAYHAAAGLVANGAAALGAIGTDLLLAAGVDAKTAPKMLGPLLRSVTDNIEMLGFPDALTGPVRRGDAAAVERAYRLIQQLVPHATALYGATVAAQLPLAEALAEAPPSSWVTLRAWVRALAR